MYLAIVLPGIYPIYGHKYRYTYKRILNTTFVGVKNNEGNLNDQRQETG